MDQVGRGPYRVCYLGGDEEVREWVRAGFERADAEVEVVVPETLAAGRELLADAQQAVDPRVRSPLSDTPDPFDCVVCADDGDWDVLVALEELRDAHADLPIVLFVEDGSEQLAGDAIAAGVTDYVRVEGEDPTGELARRVCEHCERARAEARRRRDGERAQRLLEGLPDLVTVVRPGAVVGYHNDAVESVLGEGVDVAASLPFERVHQDDWQRLREGFYDAVIDPEYVPDVEFRVRDGDGEWRTVAARGRNMLSDPLVRGFVVVARDVTERKERERDLQGYRRVVENVDDPIYVLDREGTISWVNDAFLEYTGFDRSFVEGTHVSWFMREADVEAGAAVIEELLGDDDRCWAEVEFAAENVEGEINRFSGAVAVLTDDDGRFRGSVGVISDVTDAE